MAVDLISEGFDVHHLYAAVVEGLRSILREDWIVHVAHTLHEANFCADWVAKERARDSVAFRLWHSSFSAFSDASWWYNESVFC